MPSRVLAGSADSGTADRNPESGELLPMQRQRRTAFFPPVITAVKSNRGSEDGSVDGVLPTLGGSVSDASGYAVVITGRDLGPI